MLGHGKIPAQGIPGEAVLGHGIEDLLLQTHERDRVHGQGRFDRVDQSLMSVLGAEGGGQIHGDLEQQLQLPRGYHFHNKLLERQPSALSIRQPSRR